MEEEIKQIEEEITSRHGTLYSFEDVRFQAISNDKWLQLITFKPIQILQDRCSYEYKNDTYMVPISDIDLYQSILIHVLKSKQPYVNIATTSNDIMSHYIIFNEHSLISSVSYIPGRIIWTYKDGKVEMDEGYPDIYLNILNSLHNGFTTTQNIWKRDGIIMYSNIYQR